MKAAGGEKLDWLDFLIYTISKAEEEARESALAHIIEKILKESGNNTLPVNVASILQRTFLGEKHFFQATEGKVIPFIMVITPDIRD